MQQTLVNKGKIDPPREKGKERKKERSQKQYLDTFENFKKQFENLKDLGKEYPNQNVQQKLKHVFEMLNKSRNILKHNLNKMYEIGLEED